MKASLSKSEIKGKVNAPSSKSYTIRGLMCAALAKGESEIVYPLAADDTYAAGRVLAKIGVGLDKSPYIWRVQGGNLQRPFGRLYCGDSAATLRFMTAISSLIPGKVRLTTGESLAQRPLKPLLDALQLLGVQYTAEGGLPPVTVQGGGLKGGYTELPGDISSQYVSALLLAAPLAKETVRIKLTTPLESKPYVLMTIECLNKFGIGLKASEDLQEYEITPQKYHSAKYVVEGDWSSVSYLMALGVAAGEVTVGNLNLSSLQGDRVIMSFLQQMGAYVTGNENTITVKQAKLKAIITDLSDCIDLLPTMAVLAAVAEGTSELHGISRARLKESDRVSALVEGLQKMGVTVREIKDTLIITGSQLQGAVIDAKNDHRIAMAFSILGVIAGNTVIEGAECVGKTYPEFWRVLQSIGGKVKKDGK
ncbi:MAG: 3-phosphoshikimate 1-carboxyvinyltransferase [Dehalococcoidales bacterium]|nr:3-phosphoshikimate 1-carboxyvinyltransferase [Dehalococcoidales bacterium]